MSLLNKIVKNKKIEIRNNKIKLPLSNLKPQLKKSIGSFKKAISRKFGIIGEIKKASPSEGVIRKDFDAVKIAKAYKKSGVRAVSVLTDKKFFGGGLGHIDKVKKAVNLPILRKDFIIDEYQIYESRFYGADAILLIAKILSRKKIDKFIKIAKKYGMDCLVEVHTEKELKKALKTKAEIIGINNRDLNTLKVDLNTALNLVKKIPENKVVVSESGFKSREDIIKVKGKVNAVLIGSALMKVRDIEQKLKKFI